MRSPDDVVSRDLERWAREELTLDQFVRVMKHHGWTRRQIYLFLERDTIQDRFSNHPRTR